MKKSVCIEMLFSEVPFEDRFGLTKESGFDYLEFWSWKDKDIQKIKELCRANDLKIASFSGDQDFSMIDANQKADYVAFVQESIEIAKFLNCENLVIHSNALGENGVVINHYRDIADTNKNCGHAGCTQNIGNRSRKIKRHPGVRSLKYDGGSFGKLFSIYPASG